MLQSYKQITNAQAGMRLCCSLTPKTGFLAWRPIYEESTSLDV